MSTENMDRTNDEEDRDGALFHPAQVRNYLVFVLGSIRRHKALTAIVLSSVMAAAIAAIVVLPKTYHVEAKLLAQRNQVLAVRGDGPDAVAPTRGAVETVQRRDNLVALIQATDLVHHWQEHRAPAQRIIDTMMRPLRGEESEQDRIDALVEQLEKRLVVWTSDGTVSIAINWPDAKMACRLVEVAQQNFLEVRYAQEITALVESITIVKSHAGSLSADIDDAVAGVEKLLAERAKGGGPATPAGRWVRGSRPIARASEPRPELVQLKATLDAKQRVIDDLEQARRLRLADIQTRLVEQRATYTQNHPVIVDLQQTISALSVPSPQVKVLSQEVAALRANYERASAGARYDARAPVADASPSSTLVATPPQLPSEIMRLDQELREDRDPATVYARGRLRDAMEKYAALRAQVQAAQIDLETAQAAFKYRYSVVTPAQLPKRPVKPNVLFVLIAAFIGALIAAVVAAIVADVRSGKLVERWQIVQLLDRPILGEMVLPRLPRHDPE